MQPWTGESCRATRRLHIDGCRVLMNPTTTVRLWLPCAFLLCLFVQVNASWMKASLSHCRTVIENGSDPVDPSEITYRICVERCGGGVGWFIWAKFVDGITSWLLPWIALISQLPFGATRT